MAYPFTQAPTLAEFKSILESEYQARFLEGPQLENKEDGDTYSITYFEREVEGEILQYAVVFDEGDETETRVALHLVRSICQRLKIDPARFGFTLG